MATKKDRYGLTSDQINVLRVRWGEIKRSGTAEEFGSFDAFVKWSAESFDYGTVLRKFDETKPMSPENCQWVKWTRSPSDMQDRAVSARQWDEFTEPLRKKYASELRRLSASAPREFFRYEHPDIVRERAAKGMGVTDRLIRTEQIDGGEL